MKRNAGFYFKVAPLGVLTPPHGFMHIKISVACQHVCVLCFFGLKCDFNEHYVSNISVCSTEMTPALAGSS